MDDSIDDFKQNFKLIKEKKFKLAQISKYLSPSQPSSSTSSQSKSPVEENASDNANKLKAKPSLCKFNETVKDSAHVKSKSKLKSSKSTISNYFSVPSNETASKSVSQPAELTTFKCPLCALNLTSKSESERQTHVNQCLDQDFSSKPAKNKFKLNEKLVEPLPVAEKTVESMPCTSSSIKQHVEEVSVKETSVISEDAEERQKRLNQNLLRDAVPNCPICGKILQTLIVLIF